MDENQLLKELESKMAKAVDITRGDIATIRTGRATPALVENILLEVYGGSTKLKISELATITTADASTLTITPFDPSIISEMLKGLQETNRGFTPVIDGDAIRIALPPLSQEQRKEYIRFAKQKIENGKVMVRQIRHDAMSKIKRAFETKEVTEDDRNRLSKKIQEATDKMNKELDEMGAQKEKELLQL